MSPTLTTERLVLRPPRLEDAARLGPLLREWDVVRMTGSIPYPQPDIGLEGYFLIMEARAALGVEVVLVIEVEAEGPIGVMGLHRRGQGVMEMGYWLGRPFWGRGYGSEAASAAAHYAFAELGCQKLIAGHYTDNPASGRVLEKAGFAATGEVVSKFCLARKERAFSRELETWAEASSV
jgi:RimJ/RimL family protein N-acetyltransferase